jgi:hypothetical protein
MVVEEDPGTSEKNSHKTERASLNQGFLLMTGHSKPFFWKSFGFCC